MLFRLEFSKPSAFSLEIFVKKQQQRQKHTLGLKSDSFHWNLQVTGIRSFHKLPRRILQTVKSESPRGKEVDLEGRAVTYASVLSELSSMNVRNKILLGVFVVKESFTTGGVFGY